MSKIDQIGGGVQAGESRPGQRGVGAGQGASFDDFLTRAIDEGQASQAAGEPTGLGGVGQVAAPVEVLDATGQAHVTAVAQAEDLLATLEQYAQALGQGGSLKDLAGVVQAMETQAGLLGEATDQLPQDDELAGLLRQVRARAEAEAMKFNRGDFIPA